MDDTTDDEIDALYRDVDGMLLEGRFEDVDRLLAGVDVERLTTTMLLAHASITFAANDVLKEYFPYVARVRARLMQTEPQDAEALLHGFEEKCTPLAKVALGRK